MLQQQEFLEVRKQRVGKLILKRSPIGVLIYICSFLLVFFSTPLVKKSSDLMLYYICTFLVLSVIGWFRVQSLKGVEELSRLQRRSLYALHILLAATWGSFCVLTILTAAMGWSSFFVLLLTTAIGVFLLTLFAPQFQLFATLISVLFMPPAIMNLFFIKGLQGYAIGFFLVGFAGFSIVIGFFHGRNFWRQILDNLKMDAVINAIPGTLAWVNDDLRYIGVNQAHASFWQRTPDEFAGKEVGFTQNTHLKEFLSTFFKGDRKSKTELIERKKRKYFVTGNKYNDDQAAVVLGIDVTDQVVLQNQLEFQRAQSYNASEHIVYGEICHAFMESAELDAEAQKILKELAEFEGFEGKSFKTGELIEKAQKLFTPMAKTKSVELIIRAEESLEVNGNVRELELALYSLIDNALEAARESEKKKVEVVIEKNEKIQISVMDSGVGVEKDLEDVIFEPHFTTKKPMYSTGLGLSLARQLVEANNGKISYKRQFDTTNFVIELPST